MKHTLIRLLLVVSVLLMASLACNLPKTGSVPTVAPMSPEEAQQLENGLKQTLESASGAATITLTEQQINAFIAAKMAEQQDQVITAPVVKLTNGNMEIYGTLAQGAISPKIKIVLTPGIDAQGNPKFTIEEMTLGGIPAPDAIKDQINTLIDEAFLQSITDQSQGFHATQITINEGSMTINGTVQP
jgi:uncharacterized protein YpmS